ncbi:maternal effect embryo arrest protein [Perilla frutescens var. hirtella]|nr:maternal effect embryo arrest protein [Perilla frutescens var. hirtella]KAH6810750.1 maternal effect embryo arrest protein [Perilla frutescens var. frutescens]
MMNKKRLAVVPLSSPTLNGLEMQESTSTTTAAAPSGGSLKTSIHVTALDGIVNVNSLFTMAIFIGFSMTIPENATAASSAACTTSRETVRRLIVFEVVSFSFFLFSSLIAQSLKLAINLVNNMDAKDPHKADIDADYLKFGLFASAVGSVVGCTFLMLSIVDFVRVKLGALSCGGKPVYAVVTLSIFVGSGLLVYMITATYAAFFVREISDKYEEAIAATAKQNRIRAS